jgi:SAM-dependent methyltransferase
MANIRNAWSKLQWSLAHRGPAETLQVALGRLRRRTSHEPETELPTHPFDLRHGVDTGGLIGGGDLRSGHRHDVYNTAYYGMAPSRFHWIINHWVSQQAPQPNAATGQPQAAIHTYSFIDIGCGKGRALMMASEYSFRQVIGVELHASLADTAKSNLATWQAAGRPVSPVTILCQDATEFVFPHGPCLLYLFNPFAAPVMRSLIEQIELQFADRPGLLDLIYFNPESEQLFQAHPGFTRLWTGTIALSAEDAHVDRVASPDDICSVYRWIGSDNPAK